MLIGSSRQIDPGVVTYRHLLSPSGWNVQSPLRVIAHCDIDAAYAQFEMVRLGIPEDKPVAVQQWQGLIAINYPARAFGITRHETPEEALKKCPELMCVHVATYKEGETHAGYYEGAVMETHKVSLDPYRRESLKILKVFAESCHTIEKASIDEAFLDFSANVRTVLLERFPELNKRAEELPEGLDTPLPAPPTSIDWAKSGNLIPLRPPPREGSQESIDEADKGKGKEMEEEVTWQDVALSIGAELMNKCRADVRAQLGYTCSAGIARNKMLAKLCSAWKKPNAQTVLRNGAVEAFLRPLKFKKIRFLGGKLGSSIAEEYDAATVGDLWTVSVDDFQRKLGTDDGHWVWEVLRGIDHTEVAAKTATKSMLSSKNFKPPLTSWDEVTHWLKLLSSELCVRLIEAREVTPGVWPKTIVLNHRTDHYVSRSKQIAFPFTNRLTPDYVLKHSEKLAREFRDEKRTAVGAFPPCTNLGLHLNGLERLEAGAQGIERFFGGDGTTPPVVDVPTETEGDDGPPRSFVCPRCRKTVSLAADVPASEVEAALTLSRQEHDDAHFARDLLETERAGARARPPPAKRKAEEAVTRNGSGAGKAKKGTLASFFKPKT